MYLEVKVKGRKGKEAVSEQETALTKQKKMSLISAISRSGERMRFLRSPEYMRDFMEIPASNTSVSLLKKKKKKKRTNSTHKPIVYHNIYGGFYFF